MSQIGDGLETALGVRLGGYLGWLEKDVYFALRLYTCSFVFLWRVAFFRGGLLAHRPVFRLDLKMVGVVQMHSRGGEKRGKGKCRLLIEAVYSNDVDYG